MAYKQHKFISHSSGGWKSKIKVLEDLMSGEDPLPHLYHLSLCPPMVEKARELLGGSYKGPDPIHESSDLMT